MALHAPRRQARWSISRLLAVALLALGAASCARDGPRIEPLRPIQSPRAAGTQQPRLAPGESLNRVAMLVPLTGDHGQLGQSLLNAAHLAHADTGGQRIRITGYDSARGAAGAASLAIAEGNALILGPLMAEEARSVAPIARRAGVPVIAFSSDAGIAGPGIHVMGLDPGQAIGRVVAFARSRGVQRFGALVPAGAYGERAAAALRATARRAGANLLAIQRYDRSAASLRAAAAGLVPAGQYDAVLVADGARLAVQAAPMIRAGTPAARILGTELWASQIQSGGNAQLRGAWYAAPSDTLFDRFRARYRARYHRDPSRLASLGYDSVLLAMRVAAEWPLGRPFPTRLLRTRDGFLGVDGAFRFGDDGVAQRALEVREVTADGVRIVSEAPAGFD